MDATILEHGEDYIFGTVPEVLCKLFLIIFRFILKC